jgi:hypothetical protein
MSVGNGYRNQQTGWNYYRASDVLPLLPAEATTRTKKAKAAKKWSRQEPSGWKTTKAAITAILRLHQLS